MVTWTGLAEKELREHRLKDLRESVIWISGGRQNLKCRCPELGLWLGALENSMVGGLRTGIRTSPEVTGTTQRSL